MASRLRHQIVVNVGILLFDEVEVLDFAGPFEVFSTASRLALRQQPNMPAPFTVFTISRADRVQARGGLFVLPQFRFDDHPPLDLLIVPGGDVAAELDKPDVIAWITAQSKTSRLVASVCTGAFLIGKAGLLDGKRATTHWEDIADLRRLSPSTDVIENERWVDEGSVITSAGISAGIDMSLHLVSRLAGLNLAVRTARQMEYDTGLRGKVGTIAPKGGE